MSECKSNTSTGKDVVAEFIIGCVDKEPVEADFKVLGAMKSKELSASYDTEDTTADDTVGDVRESIATFKTVGFSGDGLIRNVGDNADNLTDLYLHFFNAKQKGMQPTIWLRLTDPKITVTLPVVITEFSRSYPTDSSISFSLSTTATASLIGAKAEKTPEPTGGTRTVTPPKDDK